MQMTTLQTRQLAANKIINIMKKTKNIQFLNQFHKQIQNKVRQVRHIKLVTK